LPRSTPRDHQKELVSIQAEGIKATEEAQQARLVASEKRLLSEREAEAAHAQALAEMEREHAEAIGDLRLDLSRKLEDYDRERVQRADELADRLAGLERGYNDKVAEAATQREGIEQDAADKRLDIDARLKERTEALEEKHQEKLKKIKEGITEIEGKISGNAWALIKNGRRNIEDFLGAEDRKRYQALQQQLADEQAEREKQAKKLRDDAETALMENARQEAEKLGQIEERLAKEKEALDRATQDANERYALDTENRRIAHERAVEDLQLRIERELAEYDRQQQALEAKREEALGKAKGQHEAELAAIQDKHSAAHTALEERLKAENERYAEQGAALRTQYQAETDDLRRSLQERTQATREKLAEMAEAHGRTQYDLRYQLYETSREHQERMNEIARQWDGPLSKAQEYADALARAAAGAALANAPATNYTYGGARAMGGDVDPGRMYLVGKRGPELLTSRQTAAIVNNQMTQALLAGGGSLGGGMNFNAPLVSMGGVTVTNEADEQRLVDRATSEMEACLKSLFKGGRTQQEVATPRFTIGPRLGGG
jgi:hypothetical protein